MKEIETIIEPLPLKMFITKASTSNSAITKAINIFLYLFFISFLVILFLNHLSTRPVTYILQYIY